MTDPVALVHDYITQHGGAERVVLSLAAAFPEAPIYTSLFEPESTFPKFLDLEIRPLPINRSRFLRTHHHVALPFLAPSFSHLHVDAEVAICSSSGWAHGAQVTGRKVVYCHTPARWLYQADRYLANSSRSSRVALSVLSPLLRRWDQQAAATADRYIVNSRAVRDRVKSLYGVDADVIPPPVNVVHEGDVDPVAGIEPGYFLCVSRLLPYKNVEAVAEAFARLPDHRLIVVGSGPLTEHITAMAPPNVTMLGGVSDANLRWIYASSIALVTASYEDFGLTPVEAASYGKPTVALRWGGFLDTIVEGSTGVFFDQPEPERIAEAILRLADGTWDPATLRAHAEQFSDARFVERMKTVVAEELVAP